VVLVGSLVIFQRQTDTKRMAQSHHE
jgi:hypothetical protein